MRSPGSVGPLTLAAVAAALSFFSFLPTSYKGFAEMGAHCRGRYVYRPVGEPDVVSGTADRVPASPVPHFRIPRTCQKSDHGSMRFSTPLSDTGRVILCALVPVVLGRSRRGAAVAIRFQPPYTFGILRRKASPPFRNCWRIRMRLPTSSRCWPTISLPQMRWRRVSGRCLRSIACSPSPVSFQATRTKSWPSSMRWH